MGNWRVPLAVAALGIPFLALRILGLPTDAPTYATAAGLALISASAVLLGFATSIELGSRHPLFLSLAMVIAVLPELAIEHALLRVGASDATAIEARTTILSGSVRLVLGFGIGGLLLMVFQRLGRRGIQVDPWHVVLLAFVGFAGLYTTFVALKRAIEPADTAVLLAIGIAYLVARSRRPPLTDPVEIPNARIPAVLRWPWPPIAGLAFTYAVLLAIVAAEPFVLSLREASNARGSDVVVAVQTFGAVVTKLPLLAIVVGLVVRRQPALGLAVVLTTAIAQLTLGLGSQSLLAWSVAGSGSITLTPRQLDELLLAGGQSLFTVAVGFGLAIVFTEAMVIGALFLFQLLIPDPGIRRLFAIGYVMFAVLIAGAHPLRRRLTIQGPRLAWRAVKGTVEFSPFSAIAPVTAQAPPKRARRRR